LSHIFLSYSRRDAGLVDNIAAKIERAGYRTWVDRKGIAGGEQWRLEIVAAIQSAAAMALFLSPNSVRSENVRKEIDLADAAKVRVLPIAISPAEIPQAMQYQLAGIQVIEHWRNGERAIDELLAALRRQTAPSGRPPATTPAASREPKPQVNLADLGGSRLIDLLNINRIFKQK
jgi:hypothetical protein